MADFFLRYERVGGGGGTNLHGGMRSTHEHIAVLEDPFRMTLGRDSVLLKVHEEIDALSCASTPWQARDNGSKSPDDPLGLRRLQRPLQPRRPLTHVDLIVGKLSLALWHRSNDGHGLQPRVSAFVVQ
jgi:hypothetical protein